MMNRNSVHTQYSIFIFIVPSVIPYIVFNSSISTVTNINSTHKVNAPRPITLLGSSYSSISVSKLYNH